MKAFIDTSTLFKKYVNEEGSDDFDQLLKEVIEIIVSPVTWVEMNTIIERRFREKTLTKEHVLWLRKEIRRDFNYFGKILFNENLEKKCLEIIQRYQLKTLESLQLAAGSLAKPDIFITSDKTLYSQARKELKNVCFFDRSN